MAAFPACRCDFKGTHILADQTIKGILFDKDGVLLDFQQTYGQATRAVILHLSNGDDTVLAALATDIGFDLTDNFIAPFSPLVAGHAVDICAVWANVLGIPNDRSFQVRVDLMFKQLTETNAVLIEGVEPMLARLKAGYRLGVATNDTEACATAQLENRNVMENFEFLAGYDSGHGAKPGIGMASAFLAHTGIEASNVAMVGDSIHDMTFAREAGLLAIGISTGPLSASELRPHAGLMIDSLEELPELLENL